MTMFEKNFLTPLGTPSYPKSHLWGMTQVTEWQDQTILWTCVAKIPIVYWHIYKGRLRKLIEPPIPHLLQGLYTHVHVHSSDAHICGLSKAVQIVLFIIII